MNPKKCPLWNWIALLYPLGAFFYVLSIGASLFAAWTYAVGNLGYLLAVITIYPGQFVLFGLKTRLSPSSLPSLRDAQQCRVHVNLKAQENAVLTRNSNRDYYQRSSPLSCLRSMGE